MENKDLKIAILNLVGELPSELMDYCEKRGLAVVEPSKSDLKLNWTHIFVKDIFDFSILRKTYNTIENDVKIISLTKVSDPQNFILANGKLILDEGWMKSPLGTFILDKFFQEYGGINLGDNYPKFTEKGGFNITNPFSTGDNLDRMVQVAYTNDFAALSIKTFFDHLIMFLTGLKNKNKVGLPIEVTYGEYDEVFGLQLHFFAENLMIEDITSCLTNGVSRKAEEYLLSIAVNASDFFDFTFLSEVKKVVITGLWTKDERLKMENRGLMFTNLTSSATIQALPYEGMTSQLLQNSEIYDKSFKVNLPDPDTEVVSGEALSETLAQKISEDMDLLHIQQILKGEDLEDDPNKIVVGTTDEMQDVITMVKGTFDEETEIIKVSGNELDPDLFAVRIADSVSKKANDSMSLKSFGENFPDVIKRGLFDFASKQGKSFKDLNESDLHIFKNTEVPIIVRDHTIIGGHLSKQVKKDLRLKLEQGLISEFMEDSADAALSSIKNENDEMRLKQLLKSTLKSTLEASFQLSEKDSITDEEKDILVRSLSTSLSEEEHKIRDILAAPKQAKEKPLFHTPSSASDLEFKVLKMENDSLKNKLKAMANEVMVLKESRLQMSAVQLQAKHAAAAAVAAVNKDPDQDEKLRKHFQQRLQEQEVLNEEEQKKLSSLMERETKLIENSRDKEMEARKIQLEAAQKEAVFTQMIEKSIREVKAKDLMLLKSRETFQKAIEKKDFELKSMQGKIDNLSLALTSGQAQANQSIIKDLEKQNQNMAKIIQLYKATFAGIMGNMHANKNDDGSSKEEVRKLQMLNNQFKNQMDTAKKEIQKFQDKVAYDATQIALLRTEKIKIDGLYKKLAQDFKKETVVPQPFESTEELKKLHLQNNMLENQIKDTTIKHKEAETRLAEALKTNVKQNAGLTDDKRVAHLEASVKKLSSDLIEARNQAAEMKKETNKVRQEKTALQNHIDKLKKDSDKATKAAAPKKPDGAGGKAA